MQESPNIKENIKNKILHGSCLFCDTPLSEEEETDEEIEDLENKQDKIIDDIETIDAVDPTLKKENIEMGENTQSRACCRCVYKKFLLPKMNKEDAVKQIKECLYDKVSKVNDSLDFILKFEKKITLEKYTLSNLNLMHTRIMTERIEEIGNLSLK